MMGSNTTRRWWTCHQCGRAMPYPTADDLCSITCYEQRKAGIPPAIEAKR